MTQRCPRAQGPFRTPRVHCVPSRLLGWTGCRPESSACTGVWANHRSGWLAGCRLQCAALRQVHRTTVPERPMSRGKTGSPIWPCVNRFMAEGGAETRHFNGAGRVITASPGNLVRAARAHAQCWCLVVSCPAAVGWARMVTSRPRRSHWVAGRQACRRLRAPFRLEMAGAGGRAAAWRACRCAAVIRPGKASGW